MKQQMAPAYPAARIAENRAEHILEGLRFKENQIQAWPPEEDVVWLIEYIHLQERRARKASNQRKALAGLHEAYDRLRLRVVLSDQGGRFRRLVLRIVHQAQQDNTNPTVRTGWLEEAEEFLKERV